MYSIFVLRYVLLSSMMVTLIGTGETCCPPASLTEIIRHASIVYILSYKLFVEAGRFSISQINGFSTGLLIEISTAMTPSASLTVILSCCTEQNTSATEKEERGMTAIEKCKVSATFCMTYYQTRE